MTHLEAFKLHRLRCDFRAICQRFETLVGRSGGSNSRVVTSNDWCGQKWRWWSSVVVLDEGYFSMDKQYRTSSATPWRKLPENRTPRLSSAWSAARFGKRIACGVDGGEIIADGDHELIQQMGFIRNLCQQILGFRYNHRGTEGTRFFKKDIHVFKVDL